MGKKKKYDPDKTFHEQRGEDELSWQAKACKIVSDAGGFAERIEFKLKGGCPDTIMGMPETWTVLVEFKMGSMKIDPLQRKIFSEMINSGFDIVCICVYAEGKDVWFIEFDYETGKEIRRCQPNDIAELLWKEP